MTEDLKHSTQKLYIEQEDGSTVVETRTYHDKPVMFKREVIQTIKTSHGTVLADVISCLDVLKGKGTPELTIAIKLDENNLPKVITKTYTLERQYLNKKN